MKNSSYRAFRPFPICTPRDSISAFSEYAALGNGVSMFPRKAPTQEVAGREPGRTIVKRSHCPRCCSDNRPFPLSEPFFARTEELSRNDDIPWQQGNISVFRRQFKRDPICITIRLIQRPGIWPEQPLLPEAFLFSMMSAKDYPGLPGQRLFPQES